MLRGRESIEAELDVPTSEGGHVEPAAAHSLGSEGTRHTLHDKESASEGESEAVTAAEVCDKERRATSIVSQGGASSAEQFLHAYQRLGFYVFPLRPRAKTPATPHGCKDATNDLERILRYWQRVPSANVAIATGAQSGVWVLDVDHPHGFESLAALEKQYGTLHATLTQRTGGGGVQLLWRWPRTFEVRNSAGKLGRGLDVRGSGGYVVAPPSIHPETGDAYVWLDAVDDGSLRDDVVIADAPAWLLQLVTGGELRAQHPAQSSAELPREIAGVLAHLAAQPAEEGGRNDATYWAACRLFDHGLGMHEVEAHVLPIAARLGLEEREVLATIGSASKQTRRPVTSPAAAAAIHTVRGRLREVGRRYAG